MTQRAARSRLPITMLGVAAVAVASGFGATAPDISAAGAASAVSGQVAAEAALSPSRQIVPYVRIGLVKLGMPSTRVRQLLGKPVSIKKERDPFAAQGMDRQFSTWRYRGLAVGFSGKYVNSLKTTSPRFRTRSGIRRGSTAAAVQRAYPTFNCDRFRGQLDCWKATMSGGPATSFTFKNGHVNRIMVYIESVE